MQIDEKGLAKALRVERAAWSADHSRDHGDSPSTASMRAAITAYLSTLSLGTRIRLADGTEAVVVRVPSADALSIVKMFRERIERNGEWDDGCFYYRGSSASELQEPLAQARAMLSALETK